MSKGCPFCDYSEADSNLDYKCPKCGKAFWTSKETYGENLKKNARTSTNLDYNNSEKAMHKAPKLGIKRIVISLYSAEYLFKGVVSAMILFPLGFVLSVPGDNLSKFYIVLYTVVIYWTLITVGYIYGYWRYRINKKRFSVSDKILFTMSVICFSIILYLSITHGDNNLKENIGFWIIFSYILSVLFSFLIYGIRCLFFPTIKSTTTLGHQRATASIKPIHCHKCGKKIDDDSNFCIFCGSEVANKELN